MQILNVCECMPECPSDYAINTYTYIVLLIKRATYISYCLFKYLLWMLVFIISMHINTMHQSKPQRFVMQFESIKDVVMQFESINFIYFFLRKFSGIFALY